MNLLKVTVRAKFSNYIYFFYRFSKVCEVQLNPGTQLCKDQVHEILHSVAYLLCNMQIEAEIDSQEVILLSLLCSHRTRAQRI